MRKMDKWIKQYGAELVADSCKLSDGLFHSEYILNRYKERIWERLEEIGVIKDAEGNYKMDDIEWDHYDRSIELMDCEEGFTLTSAQRDCIKDEMGFSIIFVNYKKGPHSYSNHTAAMDAMPVINDGDKT